MKTDEILFQAGKIQFKTSRFLARGLEKLGVKGLSPSHGEIIGALLMHGPMTMTEAAEFIDKDKSTLTALVKKLINLGCVTRTPDPEDARVKILRLTPEGKALKEPFMDLSRRLREKAYKDFSEEEKTILSILLAKLSKNL